MSLPQSLKEKQGLDSLKEKIEAKEVKQDIEKLLKEEKVVIKTKKKK